MLYKRGGRELIRHNSISYRLRSARIIDNIASDMEKISISSMAVPSMIPFKKQNLKRGREVDSSNTLDETRDLNTIG